MAPVRNGSVDIAALQARLDGIRKHLETLKNPDGSLDVSRLREHVRTDPTLKEEFKSIVDFASERVEQDSLGTMVHNFFASFFVTCTEPANYRHDYVLRAPEQLDASEYQAVLQALDGARKKLEQNGDWLSSNGADVDPTREPKGDKDALAAALAREVLEDAGDKPQD